MPLVDLKLISNNTSLELTSNYAQKSLPANLFISIKKLINNPYYVSVIEDIENKVSHIIALNTY
jgi:hypothetical protein